MSIGDLYDADNVVVGQAAVFFNQQGVALPALSGWNTADPFDETFWTATDPDPAWSPVGATDQGWQFGADKSTQSIAIEEQSTPVGTTITAQSVTIVGSAAEDISKILALSLNARVTANAATATTPGYDELNPSDVPLYYALGLVTTNAEGFGRLIYAPKWTQLTNVSVNFRRAADKRTYPIGFQTVCKPSDIRVINFTAAKSA